MMPFSLFFPSGFTSYLFCNHKKAPAYFTSSILSSCPLHAYQCPLESEFKSGKCLDCVGSCITMGYHAYDQNRNGTIQGNFYLATSSQPPFCCKNTLHIFTSLLLHMH
jgi:hypothetical protein